MSSIERDNNPLNIKMTQLPEEKMCGLCDTKADILFPITDVLLCLPCAEALAERTDIPPVSYKLYQNLKPEGFCAKCGADVVIGVKANFHICHKCTEKLGKVERARRIKEVAQARKILSGYDVHKVI